MMPASAVQTKTWFRPRGWFTHSETTIAVNRVLRDDPSKGDMHNRQPITPRRLWNALFRDRDLWPLYVLGFVVCITQGPPEKYTTLIFRSAGFSTFDTNLLTIPPVSQEEKQMHFIIGSINSIQGGTGVSAESVEFV